jgi:hypothetical protein
MSSHTARLISNFKEAVKDMANVNESDRAINTQWKRGVLKLHPNRARDKNTALRQAHTDLFQVWGMVKEEMMTGDAEDKRLLKKKLKDDRFVHDLINTKSLNRANKLYKARREAEEKERARREAEEKERARREAEKAKKAAEEERAKKAAKKKEKAKKKWPPGTSHKPMKQTGSSQHQIRLPPILDWVNLDKLLRQRK